MRFRSAAIMAFFLVLAAVASAADQFTPLNPEAQPRVYIVLFDLDESSLTEAAIVSINRVVADIKSRGRPVSVSVVGYADRAGSDRYNWALSLRRAGEVREALIDRGVPRNRITSAGRGEADNAVPTSDATKEAANRRVEIILQ